MTSPTSTYAAWRRLSGRPGGTRLFSAAAMARVPYFASVLPHVVRMEPGLAEVRVPKWFMVKRVEVLPRCPQPKGARSSSQRGGQRLGVGQDALLDYLAPHDPAK